MTWSKFVEPIKQAPLLWGSALFYAVGALCDEMSSLGAKPGSGFVESNPMARAMDGSFVWSHAIAHDLIIVALWLIMSLIVYHGLKRWNNALAQVPAAYWFVVGGQDRYMAAVQNFWLMKLQWFNQMAQGFSFHIR